MGKVCIISDNVTLYPLASKLAQEGHDVSYWGEPGNLLWQPRATPRIVETKEDFTADLYLVDGGGRGSSFLANGMALERKLLLGGSKLASSLTFQPKARQKLLEHFYPSKEMQGPLTNVQALGWFNGRDWVEPFCYSLLVKRLMEGERGPWLENTGCSLRGINGRLGVEAFPPSLAAFLAKAGYRGPILLDLFLSSEAILGKDLSLSLTSPLLLLWREMLKGSYYDFFVALATGLLKRINWHASSAALGVRLSYSPTSSLPAQEALEAEDGAFKHVWPEAGEMNGMLNLAWITSRGAPATDIYREARRRIYRTAQNVVKDHEIQFRRDIGGTWWEEQDKKLHDQGWV